MADYLIELGLEEVPAGIMMGVLAELKSKFIQGLEKFHISSQSIEVMGTSRRIAILAKGLPLIGESSQTENRGPSVQAAYKEGLPTKALEGFCKGQGISPSEVIVKAFGKDSYVFAMKNIPGVEVKKVLPEISKEAISTLYFPRPMVWGESSISFIRPIRTLVSLWDDEVLPFEFAGVEADRISRGHRFLSVKPVNITSARTYQEELKQAFVITDVPTRRQLILEGIAQIEEELGLKVVLEEALLQEVLFLVEHPQVFLGSFDPAYLKLPKEVIQTTMVNHQKYFPVTDQVGSVSPHFIGVRCGNSQYLETVIRGNEKVLKARLEDAAFFYQEDLAVPLLNLREKLDKVVYQKKLGSVGDKIDRIVSLSEYIAMELGTFSDEVTLAAKLVKMDLASHMVYEFPELQGIMGSYYSREEGYSPEISASIRDHYLPISAGDQVAKEPLSIVVSLGDKFDTIAGIFKAGLIPSGSQDPYGLRRMALGILRTIIENKLPLSFSGMMGEAQRNIDALPDLELSVFEEFFKGRFKSLLEKEGLGFDLIESIMALEFEDIYPLYLKGIALKQVSEKASFEKIVSLLVRTKNILKKNGLQTEGYKDTFLVDEHEIRLASVYKGIAAKQQEALAIQDFVAAFTILEELESPLNDFFNEVMVMVEDPLIRNNRLGLLTKILELGDSLFEAGCIVQ